MLKNYCCLFEIQMSLGNPLWEEIFADGSHTGLGAEDPCVVRPFKVAVLLLSVHPCSTRPCFTHVTIQSS